MDTNTIIALASLTIVLLGALWRFSHAQGKQTQLITSLLERFDKIEERMESEVNTVHKRVDKLGERLDRTAERQVWMLGKMGINDEGVTR